MRPMGRPFAQIEKSTPCSFASVFAKYFSPGPLERAWSGAIVELACAIVVCDGSGVWPAALRVLPLQPDRMAANAMMPSMRGRFNTSA